MSGLKSTLKNASKEKDREDYLRKHGQGAGGAFVAGVRIIKPLDSFGKTLASGTNYVLPEGEVTVYDGNVRYIDEEVFKHDVEQFARRQRHVDKLVKAFLQTGDAVCMKYIGYYYDWLKPEKPAGDQREALISYMEMDGMDNDTATKRVDAIIPHDGTPDHINSYTNPSDKYTNSLNKLMNILKYTCVIFMGKNGSVAPEIGVGGSFDWTDPNSSASKNTKNLREKKKYKKIEEETEEE